MQRTFRFIALGLLLLLALLVGRTLLPAPLLSSSTPALPAGIDAHRVARHLGEAVRFKTIAHQPGVAKEQQAASRAAFTQMQEWLLRTYPLLAANSRLEVFDNGSLLFTWPGSNPQLHPVLLMAHMDVVPVAPGEDAKWQYPPFSGELAQGFVWGRGTIDTKGSLVAMLEAAETLLGQGFKPERSVLFSFGADEEIGGYHGNRLIAKHLQQQGIQLEWVSDEGGAVTHGMVPGVRANVAMVGIAEKGSVTLKVQSAAIGGHSSMPQAFDETAIGRLSLALQQIGQAPFESHLEGPTEAFLDSIAPAQDFVPRLALANRWLFGPLIMRLLEGTPAGSAQLRTVIAPTIITGGNKENVLPPDARAIVNFRIHPADSIDSVQAHVEAAVKDPQVSIQRMPGARAPSAVSAVDDAAYQYLSQTIRDSFGDTLVAPNLTLGGTDSRYFLPLTQNVFRFAPIRMTPEDAQRFHGLNERIAIEDLGTAAAFYYRLLGQLPGQGD
ncbi:M20 family peptidase [Pseudomonas sp. N040]|uniref:M20 family peptidase n=1 Tax=Pseudomonas sp. N040 TaxID=2785325 RepID=UPI0018A24F45|nr:M20 family peptidase [Pseudomonas sp. N040]MBF7730032.1 M20 family peptidase [Pseudomonas sp. N040]MBW7013674.1 M20 family peptidase [Pseudomonas sp. N040]